MGKVQAFYYCCQLMLFKKSYKATIIGSLVAIKYINE